MNCFSVHIHSSVSTRSYKILWTNNITDLVLVSLSVPRSFQHLYIIEKYRISLQQNEAMLLSFIFGGTASQRDGARCCCKIIIAQESEEQLLLLPPSASETPGLNISVFPNLSMKSTWVLSTQKTYRCISG